MAGVRGKAANECNFWREHPVTILVTYIGVTIPDVCCSGLAIKMPSVPSGIDFSAPMPNKTVYIHFSLTHLHQHSALCRDRDTISKVSN